MITCHHKAREFIEKLGSVMEIYGLPRIAGYIVGFFIIDGKRRSLDELADCLGVSKASISTNARILEQMGILERSGAPGSRKDFYELRSCTSEKIFEVGRKRFLTIQTLLETYAREIPSDFKDAVRRIDEWREFHAFLFAEFDEKIVRWQNLHSGKTSTGTEQRQP